MGGENTNVPDALAGKNIGLTVGESSAAKEFPTNMSAEGEPSSSARRPDEVVVGSIFDDEVAHVYQLPSMEQQVDLTLYAGSGVPVTPPLFGPMLPPTPRQPHATRAHETETEGVVQKQRKLGLKHRKHKGSITCVGSMRATFQQLRLVMMHLPPLKPTVCLQRDFWRNVLSLAKLFRDIDHTLGL